MHHPSFLPRWLKVVALCMILLAPLFSSAQSNPAPFALSGSNYLLSDWLSTNPAGSYPLGMAFHSCSTANPALITPTSGDYTDAYNLASGPRVAGLGVNGFYISNTTADVPSIGGAVLAISSVGRTNINVSFQAATHLAGNAASIRLQYRNSIYTSWVDVPGPIEYISNGATSSSSSTISINLSSLTANSVDNRPGLQLRWKFYYTSGTGASTCAIRLDEIAITSSPILTANIATGQITNSIFCLTPTENVPVSIPFNYQPIDTFPLGTTFTAELSDASGSFNSGAAISLGSILSDGSGNQIFNTAFPANTATGTGYRVRFKSAIPNVTGTNNASDITIKRSPTDVTAAVAYAGGYRASLSWSAPLNCFEDFLVIGKSGNNHSGTPSGNGSQYSAGSIFGLGTPFGGGYVVYKGTGFSFEVTGLQGDSTYYFTIWARYHNDWIGATVLIVTPPAINPNVFNSRKIIQAEYFWNLDPGQGNAIPLNAVDGNLNSAIEKLFANGITAPNYGPCTFNVRIKNATGSWGPIFSTVINIDVNDAAVLNNLRRVSMGEFFWNNDPGSGNGVPLIAYDGNFNQALEQLFKNGITAPQKGPNKFSVRMRDRDNTWGPAYTTLVNVDSIDIMSTFTLRKITQAEFFWNTDPGPGGGTPVLALDGNLNQAIESLAKSGIQVPKNGQNTFNLRVKDRDNAWGPVFTTTINVDSVDVMTTYALRKVTVAEYFWNSDPGSGNGTTLIALDGNLNQALEKLIKSGIQAPKNGQNTFNIRVKDRDNAWGPVFSTVVNVDSVDVMNTFSIRKITQAEFYWNIDPGQGNGTVLLAFDGALNQALEQAIKQGVIAPQKGQNVLAIRMKDRDNSWGPDYKTIVNIDSVDVNLSYSRKRIRRVEYFFDQDPGAGSGTLMNLTDGYGDYPLEQTFRNGISILPNGVHLLGVRTQDRDNNWGPVYKTTISIDTLAQNSFQVYTNPSYTRKCAGQSVTMRALGAISYVWSPATGLNTTTGDSVIATPQTTTTYMVVGTNASNQTDTAFVTIEVQEPANITAGGPLVFCQGQTVTLASNVMFGNTWNTGATTQSITVGTTGTWIVATDNECGVTYDTITTINQTPVLTTTQQNVTCNGGSNGSLSVNVASDTIAAPVTPGLLISEIFTDPSGSDSPFEWVELVATDYLNFSQTPYTVIVSNNGPGSTKGWMKGGVNSVTSNSTYAFTISTGAAAPGDVLYVGGSSMTPTGTKARVINTSTSAGDGGIGGASGSVTTGVLGNGGIADGIAVFKGTASSLDSNSIPTDAVFFGNSLSSVSLADTSKGFTLPNNDRYAGGHLKTSSYLAPNLATIGGFLRATGTYNRTTGVYSTPRTWAIVTSFTDAASSVSIASNILYSWSNGSPAKSISNLTAGNYTVTVTSAIGCTTTQSYSITQPSAITTAFSVQNNTCFGGSNGAVDASVSGGVPPYSFQWSNGAINASQSGLTAGTYTLTVTDASGCTSVSSVTIGQPPAIVITSFNPGIGNTGTPITIKGSGFTGVNAVIFDTTACLNFTVSGDTQVVAIVPQFASTGPIKLVNSSGCFGVSSTNFQYVAAFANIQVKFFIEGFYVDTVLNIMNPVLGNAGIGNFLDVDTITVFLAQGSNPANIVQTQQSILDAYGNATFDFPGTLIGQSLYIGIRHRNTIETWSKQPVLLQQQTVYDFTQ